MTLPATQAKSQFLSPVSSCEHREMVPRSHSLPTGWARSWSAPFTLCGRKTRSPNHELLSVCEQQSCKPVPKHGRCLGLRKSAQLRACLCSEQAGSHSTGASHCLPGRTGSHLPAHSSATSKGGSWLLGVMRSCLLCMLSSSSWFSPCQAGTAALLTRGNPTRVESPLLGKEAGKNKSKVAQLIAKKMSGRAKINEE